MRSWKRMISLLLVLAMTASYLPAPAYAEDVVEEIVEEVVEETAVEVISEEVAEEVMEETEEIEDITEDVVEEVIEEVPEEMPEEIIFDRVTDSVAAADETGFAPADGAVVSYDLTVASQQVTSAALEGTGWRYDPEANVLYLESDFSGNINSSRDDLTILVDGTVSVNGIYASVGDLTIQGKTGRESDSVKISSYYRVIVSAGDLTVKDVALSVSYTGDSALLVGTPDSNTAPVGCLTVENARVSASSVDEGRGARNGIRTGTLVVEGDSYVYGSSGQAGIYGIYAALPGSSFSTRCHVEAHAPGGAFYAAGLTVSEYAYVYNNSVYGGPWKRVSADDFADGYGTAQNFEFVGREHGTCVSNGDGKTHTLDCDCFTSVLDFDMNCADGEKVCGAQSVCPSCGQAYGEVSGHIFDKETHKCSCGAIGGWCGDYATWDFDEATGVLTVSGRADMYDYASAYDQPWRLYRDKIRSVVIGDEITAVGDYAFGGTGAHEACLNLTEVTLGKKVMGIGSLAFGFCQSLEEIILPDSVTRVDESAFAECLALSDVTLSRNLKKVTGFTGCKSLKTIEIPEGVTEVGGFQYSGLTSITLPESVTTISAYAFAYCNYLAEVNLPQSLTTIDRYAFNDCLQLTNVTIPAGVKTIGDYAFGYGYSSKVHIFHFEGDAPTISATAFQTKTATAYYPADKSGWTSYKLQNYGGKSITWIAVYPTGGTCGDNVTWSFEEATGVLTISGEGPMDDCTYSGYSKSAPWDCLGEKIREVVVESGVTSVGSNAFSGYENLTKVTLADTVTTIGSSAFANLQLTSIDLSNVTELGRYAFSNCSYLSQVTFGEGLKEIPNSAFEECRSLVRVELPESVTSIGEMSFTCCNGLTEVVLPDSLTSIGYMAFADCDLRTVTLPKNLQYLDDYAFVGNYDLTEITFTGNAPAFHEYALFDITATAYYPADGEGWAEAVKNQYGAEELTWVAVQPTSGTCGEDATWSFDEVSGVLTISGTGSTYDYSSFSDLPPWVCWAEDITKVVVASGITRLGNYAFRTVDNSYTKLTDVELADSVICIGTSAFINLETLTYINLSHVTELEFNAFFSCGSLETVVFNDDMQTIGNGAFTYCDSLKNVQLPRNLKRIEPAAFAYCANAFTDLVIPEGVTFIGNMAFYGCDSMESLVIPGTVSQINSEAFAKNPGLKKITFLGSAPYITEPIFGDVEATAYYPGNDATWTEEVRQSYGGNITWVPVYPISGTCGTGVYWKFDASTGTLTTYGEGYLDGYYAPPWLHLRNQIKHVVVEEGVCSVRNGGFMNAFNLETVEIADTVTYIGGAAFSDCTSLEEIIIPASVTSFEKNVFMGCTGLKQITFLGSAPELQSDAIFGTITATAYYPAGDESWTEEVRQSYGGNITWVPWGEVAVIDSGECGEALTWELTSDGVLTISGTGFMDNYYEESAPWLSYWDQITALVVEHGVESIGYEAFYGCAKLAEVTLPDTLSRIGENAFAYCSGLTEITMPLGIAYIDRGAFNEAGLNQIAFRSVAPNIADDDENPVFGSVRATVTYPKDDTSWTDGMIYNQYGGYLTWEGVDIGCVTQVQCGPNALWKLDYNGKVTISGTGEVRYFGALKRYSDLVTSIEVCDGITSITGSVISGMKNAAEVRLADSITYLDGGSLSELGVESLTLPKNLTNISGNLFRACTNLKEIVIPDAVEEIGIGAFIDCTALGTVTIGKNVRTIQGAAFRDCTALKTVHLNSEVLETIGYDAFRGCSSLTGVLRFPDTLTSIGATAFFYCTSLQGVIFPENLETISSMAFSQCTALTGDLVIPAGTVGSSAFSNTAVETVTLGKVTKIDSSAFSNCGNLSKVIFTGNAPEFGSDVFFNNTMVAVYPANNDTWTEAVRQGYGGISVQWVSDDGLVASGECGENLAWELDMDGVLTISGTGPMYDYGSCPWSDYRDFIKTLDLQEGMTTIGQHAFSQLQITSVVIPEGVTAIGNSAFSWCSKLAEVSLPETVTEINSLAFAYGLPLEEIEIPLSVIGLYRDAFYGAALKTITFWGAAPNIAEYNTVFDNVTATVYYPQDDPSWTDEVRTRMGGNLTWEPMDIGCVAQGKCGPDAYWKINQDGLLTISGTGAAEGSGYDIRLFHYADLVTAIEVKDGITSLGGDMLTSLTKATEIRLADSVTVIGDRAFYGMTMETLELPENLTAIGTDAFCNCTNLKNITIPDSVKTIGSGAFANSGLESIVIPDGVETIETGAFSNCAALTKATIGAGVKTIGQSAFSESSALKTLELRTEILETIGSSAFSSCTALTGDLIFPETLTSIGNYAFYYCGALNGAVEIPGGTVGNDAFSQTGIRSVTFGDVTEIGSEAFWNCQNLTKLHFTGNAPVIGSSAFGNVKALALYPAGNATWTDEIFQDQSHNGTIVWAPYGGLIGSGSCGENLTWELSGDGILTISGTGDMEDFRDRAPWWEYRNYVTSLVLPEGLTHIGESTFDEVNISEVEIPSSVVTIGDYAFSDCKLLKTVTMHNGLQTIGRRAFSQCDSLEEIVLPDTVREIGVYSFNWCDNLKKVVMPVAIARVGSEAFAGDTALETVIFSGVAPDNLQGDTFAEGVTATVYYPQDDPTWNDKINNNYGGNLTWVPMDTGYVTQGMCGPEAYWHLDNSGCLTIFGAGAASDWTQHNKLTRFADRITAVVVEEGITSLSKNLLGGLTSVKSLVLADSIESVEGGTFAGYAIETVTLPTSLKQIEEGLFRGCLKLQHMEIPGNVEVIDNAVFYGCTALETVTFNEGLVTIGGSSFRDCSALTGSVDFPDSLGVIGEYAFYNCAALDGTLTISGKVTDIGSYAFVDCAGLDALILEEGIKTIGDLAFIDCAGLTGTLTIPDSVTDIGSGAFCRCTGFTELELGSGLLNIGSSAFSDCSGIETFNGIPGKLKAIDNYAFDGCVNMKGRLAMPDTLEYIGDQAFYNCKNIQSLATIGKNLTYLGASAFEGCSNMRGSVVIPDGITEIYQGTFENCSYLTGVSLGKNLKAVGVAAFSGCGGLKTVPVLPEGLETIDNYAFYQCGIMEGTLSIPATVRKIGQNAFGYCYKINGLELPENGVLKTIGDRAFTSLENVTGELNIPDSVTDIGEGSFAYMRKITGLKLGSRLRDIPEQAFIYMGSMTADLVIPDTVETIGSEAFAGIGSKRVVIGEGVWAIGSPDAPDAWYNPFRGSQVTEIDFTAKEYVESIFIDSDFTEVNNLAVIRIPWEAETEYKALLGPMVNSNVRFGYLNYGDCGDEMQWHYNEDTRLLAITGMGEMWDFEQERTPWYCFHDEILDVEIDGGVTRIGDYAFQNIGGLKRIALPQQLTSIGENAFASTGLVAVNLPDSVTEIGNAAFYNCENLEAVTLPEMLEEIPSAMFSQCDALASITIPAAVKRIGGSAFNGSGLKEITFLGGAPEFGNEAVFGECILTAYCSEDASWNSSVWKDYGGTVTWVQAKVDEAENQIQGLAPGMSQDAVEKFVQSQGYEQGIYQPNEKNTSGGLVATGDTVTVGDKVLTIVVTGDVDGDAVMDENDLQKIMDHVGKGGDHKLHGAYRDAGCAYKGRAPEDDINVFDIYAILDSLKAHK